MSQTTEDHIQGTNKSIIF